MFKKVLCCLFLVFCIFSITNAEEKNISELQEKNKKVEIGEEEKYFLKSLGDIADSTKSDGKLITIEGFQYYIDNVTGEKSRILTSEEINTKNNAKLIKEYEGLEVLIRRMKDEILKEVNKKHNDESQKNTTKYILGVLFVLILLNSGGIVYLVFKRK